MLETERKVPAEDHEADTRQPRHAELHYAQLPRCKLIDSPAYRVSSESAFPPKRNLRLHKAKQSSSAAQAAPGRWAARAGARAGARNQDAPISRAATTGLAFSEDAPKLFQFGREAPAPRPRRILREGRAAPSRAARPLEGVT